MNDSYTNILLQNGYSIFKKNQDSVGFKNEKGNKVFVKSNGQVEGFIKGKISENFGRKSFQINDGKLSKTISLLTLVGTLISYFTTDLTIVCGESMEPTLKNFQVIVNSKLPINKMINRNCIVRFKSIMGDTCIKRVVGLPGDTVEATIKGGFKINGKLLDKETMWIVGKHMDATTSGLKSNNDMTSKFKLDENQYFVLGDNLDNSTDSRHFGPIDGSCIMAVIVK